MAVAFEFLRNSALDANWIFCQSVRSSARKLQAQSVRGKYRGPVVLPKLYNGKSKTFSLPTTKAAAQSACDRHYTLPSELQRQGNFRKTFNARGTEITIYILSAPRPTPTTLGHASQRLPGQHVPRLCKIRSP